MLLHLFGCCNLKTIQRNRLNESFKVMTNWDWLENKHGIRKIYKIEKKLFNHFFDPFLTVIVSNKIMWPLESVIKEFTVLKIFFSNSIPASDHLYGCVMEEL